jgi:hypothetical protein
MAMAELLLKVANQILALDDESGAIFWLRKILILRKHFIKRLKEINIKARKFN